MRFSQLVALAVAAETAHGYLDTSPFFMFSTSEILSSTTPLQLGASLTSDISSGLSQCPSEFYIVIVQPGVTTQDFSSRKTTPTLTQQLSPKPKSNIRSSSSIPEVVGEVDSLMWESVLQSHCGVEITEIDASTGTIPTTYDKLPRLLNVYFPAPSASSRAEDLNQNDAFLASILDVIPSHSFTVLYTTTAGRSGRSPHSEATSYEMDGTMQDALHTDLKRDVSVHDLAKRGNQTMIDGPLFDKYQFFTPGIFMGLVVAFILLSIAYVGISALSSLQVTYAAFDKETGLAAKKQQ